jgi:hypothetical protein
MGEDDRNRVFNFEQKGPLADLAARNRMAAAGDAPTFPMSDGILP